MNQRRETQRHKGKNEMKKKFSVSLCLNNSDIIESDSKGGQGGVKKFIKHFNSFLKWNKRLLIKFKLFWTAMPQ